MLPRVSEGNERVYVKWSMDNKRGLLFSAVYSVSSLQYVDKLLEAVRDAWVQRWADEVKGSVPESVDDYDFSDTFTELLKSMESAQGGPRKMRSFEEGRKCQ